MELRGHPFQADPKARWKVPLFRKRALGRAPITEWHLDAGLGWFLPPTGLEPSA
jgi:hypothetical protein